MKSKRLLALALALLMLTAFTPGAMARQVISSGTYNVTASENGGGVEVTANGGAYDVQGSGTVLNIAGGVTIENYKVATGSNGGAIFITESTLNLNTAAGNDITFQNNYAAGVLNDIYLMAGATANVTGSGNVYLNSGLAGVASTFNMNGTGLLTIGGSGAGAYSGTININSGFSDITGAGGNINYTSTTSGAYQRFRGTIGSGATLDIAGGINVDYYNVSGTEFGFVYGTITGAGGLTVIDTLCGSTDPGEGIISLGSLTVTDTGQLETQVTKITVTGGIVNNGLVILRGDGALGVNISGTGETQTVNAAITNPGTYTISTPTFTIRGVSTFTTAAENLTSTTINLTSGNTLALVNNTGGTGGTLIGNIISDAGGTARIVADNAKGVRLGGNNQLSDASLYLQNAAEVMVANQANLTTGRIYFEDTASRLVVDGTDAAITNYISAGASGAINIGTGDSNTVTLTGQILSTGKDLTISGNVIFGASASNYDYKDTNIASGMLSGHTTTIKGTVYGDGGVTYMDTAGGGLIEFTTSISNVGSFTKSGDATFNLIGGTAFSVKNDLTLNGGLFLVNKDISAGRVVVNTNAVLGGNRTITGDLVINGGAVNPGFGIGGGGAVGTLTITGDATLNDFVYTYNPGSVAYDMSSLTTDGDLLAITGGATLTGGQVDFISAGTINVGNYYLLMTADNITMSGVGITINGAPVTPGIDGSRPMLVISDDGKSLWLTSKVMEDSLSLVWTGTYDHTAWSQNTIHTNWESVQLEGATKIFKNGDYVIFNTGANVGLGGALLVSGMEVDTAGDVTITGFGSISAYKEDSSIGGAYAVTDGSPLGVGQFATTGMLVKTGAGTLSLLNTGGNTFTEGIELHAGTLAFNDANQLGVGTGKYITFKGDATLKGEMYNIFLDSALSFDPGVTGNVEVASGISFKLETALHGTGTLAKTGAGDLWLKADNSGFGGSVNVNQGRLYVDNKLNGDVTVNTGGILLSDNTITGSLTVTGGAFSPGTFNWHVNNYATLTVGGTAGLTDFTYYFDTSYYQAKADMSDPTTTMGDLLVITGGATLSGGTFDINTNLASTGYYLLMTADSFTITGDYTFLVQGSAMGTAPNLVLSPDGKSLWITMEALPEPARASLSLNWTGGADVWSSASWLSTQTIDSEHVKTFADGDYVIFADTTQDSSVVLNTGVIISGMEVDTDQTVGISGMGSISAYKTHTAITGEFAKTSGGAIPPDEFNTTGMLVKKGTGFLVFENGANTFAEGIELYDAGAIMFNDGAQLGVGAGKAITFMDDAELVFDSSGSATLASDILINSGVTGCVYVGGNGNLTISSVIGGPGALYTYGLGTLTLTGNSSAFGGDTTVAGGTLLVNGQLGGNVGVAGTTTLGGSGNITGNLTVNSDGSVAPGAALGSIGTLTITGNATLTNFNYYFNHGTAHTDMSTPTTNGDLLVITGGATLAGGTLDLTANILTGDNYYLVMTAQDGITMSGTYTISINGEPVIPGIDDPVAELVLSADNKSLWLAITGGSTPEPVTASLSLNWNSGSGSWDGANWLSTQTIAGEKIKSFKNGDYVMFESLSQNVDVTLNSAVIVSGMDFDTNKDVTISGTGGINAVKTDPSIKGEFAITDDTTPTGEQFATTGMLVKKGAGKLTFANTGGNLFTEGIELYMGGISFTDGDQLKVGAGKALTFKGGADLSFNSTTAGTLATDISIDSGVSAALNVYNEQLTISSVISGAGYLWKNHTGTLILTGDSSAFIGETIVHGGALLVNNALGGNVNVRDNATLGGGGTITGNLAVESGGLVNPGAAVGGIGTLTITGNATLTGAILAYDITSATSDQLIISGTATLNGGTVALTGTMGTGNYKLLTAGSDITVSGVSVTLNGGALGASVRAETALTLENSDTELWLTASNVNSLYMHWNGGTGNWSSTGWESLQGTGSDKANSFQNGDFVAFTDSTRDSDVALATDVVVSGMDINTGKNVTFTGTGGISAAKTDASIVGIYAKTDGSAATADEFNTTGMLTKKGAGTLAFANTGENLFVEGIELYEGVLAFNDGDQLKVGADKAITFKDDATLQATASTDLETDIAVEAGVTGAIAVNDSLLLDMQAKLSGAGVLEKLGGGALALTGDNSGFGGSISVNAGTLLVNSALGGSVAINSGATLGGNNTITGNVTINTGGIVSPGNSIGTLTVNGDITFTTGSFFDVEVNAVSSQSDCLTVTGTAALNGATVRHIGLPGAYDATGQWTILTAADITGVFAENVDTSLYPFLTGSLSYDLDGSEKSVILELVKSTDFADLAVTRNQKAVADALDSLDSADLLYNAIVGLSGDADSVRVTYNELAGEIYADVAGALQNYDRAFGKTLRNRVIGIVGEKASGTGYPLWVSFDGYTATTDSTSNTAKSKFSGFGLALGAEAQFEDFMLGAAFRYGSNELKVNGRNAKADIDSYNLALYGGWDIVKSDSGVLRASFGGSYGWHNVESKRTITALGQHLKADYDVNTFQLFGELGYRFICTESWSVEPYAGVSWNYVKSESFNEKGGFAAVNGKSHNNSNVSTALGVRAQVKPAENFVLSADLSWQHIYGDRDPEARLGFINGDNFTVFGAPLSRDAAGINLSAEIGVSEAISLKAGYEGLLGDKFQSHGGYLKLQINF